jgi:hypothetical protein
MHRAPVPRYAVPDEFYVPEHLKEAPVPLMAPRSPSSTLIEMIVVVMIALIIADSITTVG